LQVKDASMPDYPARADVAPGEQLVMEKTSVFGHKSLPGGRGALETSGVNAP
jgi:hypothetical protein